tara:strand:- start:723 stop:824 length:102 start_codon:yes stop_codon:yes gene_type:complete
LLPRVSRRHLSPQLVTNGSTKEGAIARGLDGQK